MRRTAIAAAWLFGATIPLLAAAVFLVGCCMLPFHGVLHRVMPLCHLASDVIRGEHGDHDANDHPVSTPARQKQQEPAKRIAANVSEPVPFEMTWASAAAGGVRSNDSVGYRSFIALGALRCDQDVGLRCILIQTFRI